MLRFWMPRDRKSLAQAMPAAPAPATTTTVSAGVRPVRCRALMSAAPVTMADPC